MVLVLLVLAGVVGSLRQRAEAKQVAAGELPRLGPAGDLPDRGPVHAALAGWRPARRVGPLGRAAARALAAPATGVGVAVALLGGRRPVHDPEHDLLLATGVGGLAGRGLRGVGADAATLGRVVVCRGTEPSRRLLVHEAHHVRQQERLGPVFAAAYVLAQAAWGYRANPFEVGARRVARELG